MVSSGVGVDAMLADVIAARAWSNPEMCVHDADSLCGRHKKEKSFSLGVGGYGCGGCGCGWVWMWVGVGMGVGVGVWMWVGGAWVCVYAHECIMYLPCCTLTSSLLNSSQMALPSK